MVFELSLKLLEDLNRLGCVEIVAGEKLSLRVGKIIVVKFMHTLDALLKVFVSDLLQLA